jgi:hypothetical protein
LIRGWHEVAGVTTDLRLFLRFRILDPESSSG